MLTPPPSRRRILLIVLAVNIPLWQLIGALMWQQGLPFFSHDSIHRAVLSMYWAESPYVWPPDGYWLPLQFYLYGAWFRLLLPLDAVYWFIPLTASFMAIGATAMAAAALELTRESDSATWAASVMVPLMIHDNWRLAASLLSEPLYLTFLLANAVFMLRQIRMRPARPVSWLLFLILLCLFQLTRYEAFPLSFAIWTLACFFASAPKKALRLWLLGIMLLSVIPLGWLAINFKIWGDPLHFIGHFSDASGTGQPASWFRPWLFSLRWILHQGWPLLVLAGIGLAALFKTDHSAAKAYALLLAMVFSCQLLMNFGSPENLADPTRLVLGFVWLSAPLAVVTVCHILNHVRHGRPVILLGLALLLAFGLRPWVESRWGGPPLDEETFAQTGSIARLTRDDDHTLVVEDPAAYEFTNLLRFYARPGSVTLLGHYQPGRPIEGKFLLFHRGQAANSRFVGRMLHADVSFHHRMPPAR